MKSLIAALLLLPLLAGCGDDDNSSQSPDPDTASEPTLVQTLILTSAGGQVAPKLYPVDDRAQLKAYVKTFDDRDDVSAAVQQAVQDAGDVAGDLAVATVALGCDSPEHVSFSEGDGGWEVTAGKVPDPKPECFAPMTTIALVELPGNLQ